MKQLRLVTAWSSCRGPSSVPVHYKAHTPQRIAARSYSTPINKQDPPTRDDPSPDSTGRKERVVILGSGWGGYALSHRLSPKLFAPLIISPRPYFLFTPLLTNATGGSLDFSHVIEPVRDPRAHVDFLQANARAVDFRAKTVVCEPAVIRDPPPTQEPSHKSENPEIETATGRSTDLRNTFKVSYDKLVIAVGTTSETFDTPGVKENAIPLKDIRDGRRVRRRVQECFELSLLPTTTPEMCEWLLHFAIVGAGPTGTELAASLRDFIFLDLLRHYPPLSVIPRVTLYDVAPKVLSTFDERLSEYAMNTMRKQGVTIKTSHHVEGLRWGTPGSNPPYEWDPRGCLTLKTEEEGEVGIGMCVWATGNRMNPFVTQGLGDIGHFPTTSAIGTGVEDTLANTENDRWHVKKAQKTGALLVDGQLRVQLENENGKTAILQDVFAIGDNANPELGSPPPSAQAAYQEAKWLGTHLNKGDIQRVPPFSFRNMGMLAYVGDSRALMQLPQDDSGGQKYLPDKLTGRLAWMVWNSAYLTLSMSWRNKVRIAFRWLLNGILGRDVSRH